MSLPRRLALLLSASAIVVTLAACNPSDPATRTAITKCWNGTPQVWLTFDDYGAAAHVNAIIDFLNAHNVKARFFPTGMWANANPWIIARMVLSGHVLGNHTYSHPDLAGLSDAAVRAQIRGGESLAPDHLHLLRPPYGSGAFDPRINNIAQSEGYLVCYWTVDTVDWNGSSAATIVRRVQYGDSLTPPVHAGGVILMHMHGPHTLEALPGVLSAIRSRGLRPVPLH